MIIKGGIYMEKIFRSHTLRRLTQALVIALCLSVAPVPASLPCSPVKEAQAAITQVAKIKRKQRSNGEYDYYGYDSAGKKISNRWGKYTTSAGKNYYYYFGGLNSRAYKAYASAVSSMYKERFVTKKIGSKTYGFDEFGRRINGAWFNTKINKLYFFEKNGTYNSETTSKMRIYAKKGKRASYLLRLLGQYKKREVKEGGCFTIGSPQDDGSRLVYYTYPHIQVVTSTNTAGKTETIHLVDGLFR